MERGRNPGRRVRLIRTLRISESRESRTTAEWEGRAIVCTIYNIQYIWSGVAVGRAQLAREGFKGDDGVN